MLSPMEMSTWRRCAASVFLDWAVPSDVKLYRYTKDAHDLDVARVLLHGTKSMLALPGRTYDLLGPGWQQEHWRMGPGARGFGAHRTWLPWVSVCEGLPAWPAFSDQNPVVMYLGPNARTGPVPSVESLKVLDQSFAWRRTAERAR
jgi:hypothetical protein